MNSVMELDKKYVAQTYKRVPLNIVRGKGAIAVDDQGKEYIDLGAGIAVNAFGYADEEWQQAVIRQIGTFQHTSNLYYTEPCARVAEMLCKAADMKRVFFANSGAESNECAIKCARKWALDTYGEGHHTIITLQQSFHGRTITTLAATGQDVFHKNFSPFPGGFVHAEANNLDSVRRLAEENACAAVMIEIVQGEGGVMPLDHDFVVGVEALCREKGMLFIVDEVQTGLGRTGKFFSYMHHGVKPDIVSTAKGLGGGLPIGACLMGERVENTLLGGDHGSTFGGNPVSCAGAISILSRLTEELMAGVLEKSAYIREHLEKCPGVEAVSGMGFMLGVKTVRPAAEIVAEAREAGVLILTAKDRLRLLPPLNIPMELLQKAVARLQEVLSR